MNDQLKNLLILQERDTKLFKAREDLKSVPLEAAKIKENLTVKLKSVEAAKKAQLEAEKEVKKVELDIQTRKETITKLKMRQGETKRNEEYQMLSHELKRYSADIDELETKELELMELVDQKKIAREEALNLFAKEKELATEESQNLVARKKNAEIKIVEIEESRSEYAKKVESGALALYERIMKSRGVGAITAVSESGQCSGCNIKLPAATVHRVLASQDLVQCSECSRILYNV